MMFLVGVTEIFRASPQQHVFASLWMTSTRMFRQELQRKYFISRLSELPEGLKAVLLEMRYRAYGESLVTNRKKLIELPAEALGGDCTNSLLRELLKKSLKFFFNNSFILANAC